MSERRIRERNPARDIVHIERQEFLNHYWHYERGQHVTFLAPTQNGKTTLAYQLLNKETTPDLPVVIMVVKPRDPTVERLRQRYDYRKIRDWPPRRFPKVKGWVLQPRHRFDVKVDDEEHADIFRRAIMDSYRKGNRILFEDEVWGLEEIGLRKDMERVETRGAGMGCGQWAASQRPFAISQTFYSQAEHLFLGPTPDKRDRDRFREIGGVDPELIEAATHPNSMRKFEFLHIQRTGPTLCIVEP